MAEIRVRQEGSQVLLVVNGVATLMPYEAAMALSTALRSEAKRAEELDNVHSIIKDQALALRTGMPIALTSNRKIMAEAWKESQYTHPPGAIEPTSTVGCPALTQHLPRSK